jgi:aspartate racemase
MQYIRLNRAFNVASAARGCLAPNIGRIKLHIGLIGGIGPAATDFYYRAIIDGMRSRGAPLALTIAHADTPTLLSNMMAADPDSQAAIFSRLTDQLAGAGAGRVAVTSIAGHFCRAAFSAISSLPPIDLVDEVARRVQASGLQRVGILGTATAMTSRFYGALGDVAVIEPVGEMSNAVHQAYIDMATAGRVTDAQREVFFTAGRQLTVEAGVEAVMLGGTDLFMAFDGVAAGFEVVDCAQIHVDAIVEAAAAEL